MWWATVTPVLNSAGSYESMCTKLCGCCGVGELRDFYKQAHTPGNPWNKLEDIKLGPYTGIFVCTYTKKQSDDGLEDALNELHTLLYQTDFIINTSPMATDDGRVGGVRTAMYKWGKGT